MHYQRSRRHGTTDGPSGPGERFWAKVEKTGTCWLWLGCLSPNGYGQFTIGRQRWSTHRYSWTIANGPIPDGLFVCHHCDIRNCVRPDHLFVGTQLDNRQDCAAKGRTATGERSGAYTHPESRNFGDRNGQRKHPERVPRGERNGQAVLTADQVLEIRSRYEPGIVTYAQLGFEFGVDTTTIGLIVRRRKWKHV